MQTAAVLNAAKTRVPSIAVPWPAIGVLMFGLVYSRNRAEPVGLPTTHKTHQ